MSGELELRGLQLPADRAEWSREDYVKAWTFLDTWVKAELAASFDAAYGDLAWLAGRVGVSTQTVYKYRSVWNAYAESSARGRIAFRLAETLMAQSDRLELLEAHPDWTSDDARAFVTERNRPVSVIPAPAPVSLVEDLTDHPSVVLPPGLDGREDGEPVEDVIVDLPPAPSAVVDHPGQLLVGLLEWQKHIAVVRREFKWMHENAIHAPDRPEDREAIAASVEQLGEWPRAVAELVRNPHSFSDEDLGRLLDDGGAGV